MQVSQFKFDVVSVHFKLEAMVDGLDMLHNALELGSKVVVATAECFGCVLLSC
jgi:hypothetical protein